jgi:hypothetical protein
VESGFEIVLIEEEGMVSVNYFAFFSKDDPRRCHRSAPLGSCQSGKMLNCLTFYLADEMYIIIPIRRQALIHRN